MKRLLMALSFFGSGALAQVPHGMEVRKALPVESEDQAIGERYFDTWIRQRNDDLSLGIKLRPEKKDQVFENNLKQLTKTQRDIDNGAGFLQALQEFTATKGCIQSLVFAGHGWRSENPNYILGGPGIPGSDNPLDPNLRDSEGNPLSGIGFYESNAAFEFVMQGPKVREEKGGRLMEDLKNLIRDRQVVFCSQTKQGSCLIQFHSCNMSGTFIKELTKVSGCQVVWSSGKTSPLDGSSRAAIERASRISLNSPLLKGVKSPQSLIPQKIGGEYFERLANGELNRDAKGNPIKVSDNGRLDRIWTSIPLFGIDLMKKRKQTVQQNKASLDAYVAFKTTLLYDKPKAFMVNSEGRLEKVELNSETLKVQNLGKIYIESRGQRTLLGKRWEKWADDQGVSPSLRPDTVYYDGGFHRFTPYRDANGETQVFEENLGNLYIAK